MRQIIYLSLAVALTMSACHVKVENPPGDSGNTTVVNPPAVEKNTTVVNPPAEEKKETTTTVTKQP